MKKLGDSLSIGIIIMIGLSFLSVSLHVIFNTVSIALQEFIIYVHSTVFMLGIIYALHHDKHVRIDIFYQNYTNLKKYKVNKIGTIFLLIPLFIFMFSFSFNYVASSWSKLEGSAESGGLAFVYGLKTLLLILPVIIVIYSTYKLIRKN